MTDIGVLPTLVGQGWSVKKSPVWQTRVQRSVSGRELRVLDYPYPLWQFELTWAALGDNLGQAANATSIGSLLATDLRTLMGFFLAAQGAYATWLYDDPTDDTVLGQAIATGDGATTAFQLVRTFIGTSVGVIEPMVAPDISGARPFNVYLNGSLLPQTGNWSVGSTGILTFTSVPAAGVAITADFSYYFRCRFMADTYEFENFMTRLWSVKAMNFISVRS